MKREAFEAAGQKYDNAKIYVADKAENVAKAKREAFAAAGQRAEEMKMYVDEKKERLGEKAEKIKTKVKAYIGRSEEAEEYTVDNEYI